MSRILTCYYNYKPGGYCTRLTRAMNALLNRGHEVHYLSIKPFPINHPACKFHKFPWPSDRAGGLLFWAIFHLVAPWVLLYLGLRFRISHVFVFGTNYAFFMQPLRLIKRIPVTLFIRGDVLLGHVTKGRSSLLLIIEKLIEGLSIKGVRVFGVSEDLVKRLLGRHSFLAPAEYGVLRNEISSMPVISGALRPNKPLSIAMVGTLDKVKNHRFVFKVLSALPRDEIHLFVYGSGEEEAFLRCLAQEKNIKEMITFMGWVENMGDTWSSVDLLLMPSLHEGSPNSLLEAVSHGVPVIASDIAAHIEVLAADNLVKLNDVSEWQRKLFEVLSDPVSKLGHLVYAQTARAQPLVFDWDQAVADLIVH